MRITAATRRHLLATMVLLAFAIFALAWTGIALTRGNDRIAAVWLANGFALAIILRHPKA